MANKTVLLITGGNTGLGLEIIRALLKGSHPYHIFLGSRSLEKAGEAVATAQKETPNTTCDITSVQVDLTDDASISKAFEHVDSKVDHIDVLVNNGGMWFYSERPGLALMTSPVGANFDNQINSGKMDVRAGWNATWDLNVTGTHIMTNTFMPLLIKSAKPRLIFMTSGTSSLEEAALGFPPTTSKPPAGWPKPHDPFSIMSYRSSKAALNMLMLEVIAKLNGDAFC